MTDLAKHCWLCGTSHTDTELCAFTPPENPGNIGPSGYSIGIGYSYIRISIAFGWGGQEGAEIMDQLRCDILHNGMNKDLVQVHTPKATA